MDPVILSEELKKENPRWVKILVISLLLAISSTTTYFVGRQKRNDVKQDSTDAQTQKTVDLNRKFSLRKDSSLDDCMQRRLKDKDEISALQKDNADLARELYLTTYRTHIEDSMIKLRQKQVTKKLKQNL